MVWFAGVIASFLGGVEEGGEGAQGGVGDLGVDGGLAGGLVPQDLDVERGEQAGQDVPGQGQLVEQGRVGGLGGGVGGGELGGTTS